MKLTQLLNEIRVSNPADKGFNLLMRDPRQREKLIQTLQQDGYVSYTTDEPIPLLVNSTKYSCKLNAFSIPGIFLEVDVELKSDKYHYLMEVLKEKNVKHHQETRFYREIKNNIIVIELYNKDFFSLISINGESLEGLLSQESLNEVGEGTSEPFKYHLYSSSGDNTRQRDTYLINAQTSQGEPIKVLLFVYLNDTNTTDLPIGGKEVEKYIDNKPIRVLNTGFYIYKGEHNTDGHVIINDKTYMFRLMATIKQILSNVNDQYNPDLLIYGMAIRPKERSSGATPGRHNLYKKFIEKSLPVKKIITLPNNIGFIYILK